MIRTTTRSCASSARARTRADGRSGAESCAALTNRRKSIWRAAQQSGWTLMRRGARYRSLLTRTQDNH